MAGDLAACAAWRAGGGFIQAIQCQRASAAQRTAAGGGHGHGDSFPQSAHRGTARADSGADPPARSSDRRADPVPSGIARAAGGLDPAAAGVGGRQGHRRGRDPGEVRFPRKYEPRDPHPDERHHRTLLSRAEDAAQSQAARLCQ